VSIQAASGEIGTVHPCARSVRAARARGVAFHVDAVGAAGRLPLSVDEQAIDLLTLSSNDLYGPPGAGALWARPSAASLAPLIVGRPGGRTPCGDGEPAGIVGMAVAADFVRAERRGRWTGWARSATA